MPRIISASAGVASAMNLGKNATLSKGATATTLSDQITLFDADVAAKGANSTATPIYLTEDALRSRPLFIQLNATQGGTTYMVGQVPIPYISLSDADFYNVNATAPLPLTSKASTGQYVSAQVFYSGTKVAISVAWSVDIDDSGNLLSKDGRRLSFDVNTTLSLRMHVEGVDPNDPDVFLDTMDVSKSETAYQIDECKYNAKIPMATVSLIPVAPWTGSSASLTLSPDNYSAGYLYLAFQNTGTSKAGITFTVPTGWQASYYHLNIAPTDQSTTSNYVYTGYTSAIDVDNGKYLLVRLKPSETASNNVSFVINDSVEKDSLVYILPGGATGSPRVPITVSNTPNPENGDMTFTFTASGYNVDYGSALSQLTNGKSVVFTNGTREQSKTFSSSSTSLIITRAEMLALLDNATANKTIGIKSASLTIPTYYGHTLNLTSGIAPTPSNYNLQATPDSIPQPVTTLRLLTVSALKPSQTDTERTFTFTFEGLFKKNAIGNDITWSTAALTSSSSESKDSTVTVSSIAVDATAQTITAVVTLSTLVGATKDSALTFTITGNANGPYIWGVQQTESWTADLGPWTLLRQYYYLDKTIMVTSKAGDKIYGAVKPELSVPVSPVLTPSYQWYKVVNSEATVTLSDTLIVDATSREFRPSFTNDRQKDMYACLVTIAPPSKPSTDTGIVNIEMLSRSLKITSLAQPGVILTPSVAWGSSSTGIGIDPQSFYYVVNYEASSPAPRQALSGAILTITATRGSGNTAVSSVSSWVLGAIDARDGDNYVRTGTVNVYATSVVNTGETSATPNDGDYFRATGSFPKLTATIKDNNLDSIAATMTEPVVLQHQAALGFSQSGMAIQPMMAFVQATSSYTNGGVLVLWLNDTERSKKRIFYMNGFPGLVPAPAPTATSTIQSVPQPTWWAAQMSVLLTDIRNIQTSYGATTLQLAALTYAQAADLFGGSSQTQWLDVASLIQTSVGLNKGTEDLNPSGTKDTSVITGAKAWGYTSFTMPDGTMAFWNYQANQATVGASINLGFEVPTGKTFPPSGAAQTAPLTFSASTPLAMPHHIMGPIHTPLPSAPVEIIKPLSAIEDEPEKENDDLRVTEVFPTDAFTKDGVLAQVDIGTFQKFRCTHTRTTRRR